MLCLNSKKETSVSSTYLSIKQTIMNNNNNGNENGTQGFVISGYTHLLTKTDKADGKYICPSCEGRNLSINKDGKKYYCFDCQDTNSIAYKLRELNGEFKSDLPINKSKQKPDRRKTTDTKDDKKTINLATESLKFFKSLDWHNKLGFNVRTQKLTLDGDDVLADTFSVMIAEKYGVNITDGLALRTALHFGFKNQYDPVRDYLDNCASKPPKLSLEYLAKLVFNTDSVLYAEYLKRWVIGCVARVYEPGIKFDEALVLQGSQGLGKSTFFNILSNGFFSDSMQGMESANDIRILHQNWVCEWGELERMTNKTYNTVIKHFLSKQVDEFRLPYAKDMLRLERRSMIVGTCNDAQFLTDKTGNRRFWVIPIQNQIDLNMVDALRDEVWSAGCAEFILGGKDACKLPKEFWESQAEENLNYLYQDPWEAFLYPWLDTQIEVTSKELLDRLSQASVPVAYTRAEEMRLGDLLRSKGWERRQVRKGDDRVYVYRKSV